MAFTHFHKCNMKHKRKKPLISISMGFSKILQANPSYTQMAALVTHLPYSNMFSFSADTRLLRFIYTLFGTVLEPHDGEIGDQTTFFQCSKNDRSLKCITMLNFAPNMTNPTSRSTRLLALHISIKKCIENVVQAYKNV